MFRLGHDCTIVCKDGQTVKFTYDASKVVAYHSPTDYNSSAVDKSATTGFNSAKNAGSKYWYYNAKPLFNYIDTNH